MDEMRLSFCISPTAGVVHEASLQMPAGSSVEQALAAAATALPQFAEVIHAAMPGMVGIWGKATDLKHLLCDGDRLEIYRPLTVDPKIARRERFARQGARSTGLFKRQRPEAKAGY